MPTASLPSQDWFCSTSISCARRGPCGSWASCWPPPPAATGQPQRGSSGPPAQIVLPVLLMDPQAVATAYQQLWTPAAVEWARREGLPPASLADVRRLLGHPGIRQYQVHTPTRARSVCRAGPVLPSID